MSFLSAFAGGHPAHQHPIHSKGKKEKECLTLFFTRASFTDSAPVQNRRVSDPRIGEGTISHEWMTGAAGIFCHLS